MKIVLLFCVVLLMSVVAGKHMHPRSLVRMGEIEVEGENQSENLVAETNNADGSLVHNVRPNRFVPVNSVLFFKSYSPCANGMERDLLGICREVWD